MPALGLPALYQEPVQSTLLADQELKKEEEIDNLIWK